MIVIKSMNSYLEKLAPQFSLSFTSLMNSVVRLCWSNGAPAQLPFKRGREGEQSVYVEQDHTGMEGSKYADRSIQLNKAPRTLLPNEA